MNTLISQIEILNKLANTFLITNYKAIMTDKMNISTLIKHVGTGCVNNIYNGNSGEGRTTDVIISEAEAERKWKAMTDLRKTTNQFRGNKTEAERKLHTEKNAAATHAFVKENMDREALSKQKEVKNKLISEYSRALNTGSFFGVKDALNNLTNFDENNTLGWQEATKKIWDSVSKGNASSIAKYEAEKERVTNPPKKTVKKGSPKVVPVRKNPSPPTVIRTLKSMKNASAKGIKEVEVIPEPVIEPKEEVVIEPKEEVIIEPEEEVIIETKIEVPVVESTTPKELLSLDGEQDSWEDWEDQ